MKNYVVAYMYQRENGDYGWRNIPMHCPRLTKEGFEEVLKQIREQEGTENIVIISIIPLED